MIIPINFLSKLELLAPIRSWLDNLEIDNPQLAHRLCNLIPSTCPFEREIKLLPQVVIYIPPLCKINPFYEELVSLRFRALSYLADECGLDINSYV
ncbi:MAG: Mo-dependent nitrogenase C-terminal domain-containing protein [Mastigocoleus sp. MO_167.B18]|uniref:Mo-dependent nitrogenase C-terminal domain-containing protein n=1 Tax=Mastigocoleus sp. MO_188.B34 TaxID=3036635 RepID=UPI00260D3893|nr:Mo-dependent nitrogenase C-terminal domain-containing protein [Mastigocoleus sp. MO_188.B34]MDJ0693761.1 Mo-dependent nitrogenase C-terminal domain-containing protein [Mastigocoleus sp. MO_188.B34]MDJ0773788.1 Mo-dependent nitrogenase C-terminal domain-containing protein [Mastigocoleus sp. MO_167.B18]